MSHYLCVAEGDHIKITASKYPFPTVCSISQSTDWFQSISRTLKWNERERQKSFVVVEESPVKKRHRRRSSSTSTASASTPDAPEEALEDDDEEDTTEEEEVEEEEEKFDIDDLSSAESSPQSTTAPPVPHTTSLGVGHEKAIEQERDALRERQRAEIAARALAQGSPILRKGRRSRSRPGIESGIETPDRFPGPHPHPPKVSPRHVAFRGSDVSPSSSSSTSLVSVFAPEMDRDATLRGDRGARDDIHSPRAMNGSRNRIPRDRDIESENLRTPTSSVDRRRKSRERVSHVQFESATHPRKAFAVWGHDESDSATSDNDL